MLLILKLLGARVGEASAEKADSSSLRSGVQGGGAALRLACFSSFYFTDLEWCFC
jgi:hypothetical protein